MTEEKRGKESLEDYFSGRETLTRDELCHRYFRDFASSPGAAVTLFDFLEDVVALPLGLLRPEDELQALMRTPERRAPFGRLFGEAVASDKRLALAERIEQRLSEIGTLHLWPEIRTFGELVRAWVGQPPSGQGWTKMGS